MKPGDVVRVTVFRGRKCKPAAWGIVQEPDQERRITFFEWSGLSGSQQREIQTLNPTDWGMSEYNTSADAMKVVPPSKWPDHVCAYMAKRVLVGEDVYDD